MEEESRVPEGGAPWWRSWLRVVVPAVCPGCGEVDEVVCRRCRDRVLRGPLRPRPLADGTVAVASAPWRGPARGLVIAAKEAGRRDVADVLAAAVARGVVAVGFESTRVSTRLLLVPPPSTVRAVVRRGARPTATLATSAAALLRAAGADVAAADVLMHTRRVGDQAGLDRAQRTANLAGAFVVQRHMVQRHMVQRHMVRRHVVRRHAGRGGDAGLPPAQQDVVVVDDVLTTGATVLAVAAALRAGGYRVVGAATVASV